MPDELTPDLEARLDAWLAARAPVDIPVSLADRIADIPQTSDHALRPALALVPVTGRRGSSGLLVAAVIAAALAIVAGGLFFAAADRNRGLSVVASSSPTATPSTSATATASLATDTPAPVEPAPTSVAIWPADFRSDGILPAILAAGIDHGTIETPLGRARWIHLAGDSAAMPDPLVPMRMPDGMLAWFAAGGPGGACYDEPTSTMCTDPPPPSLSISSDALAPRVARPLPVDAHEASLWPVRDTFWFTTSDPLTVWSSRDLATWQPTDVADLVSPGPAGLRYTVSISPAAFAGDAALAAVDYGPIDLGSLLGYPGQQVGLAESGGGYVAREYRLRRDGGDKDLGEIKVAKTSTGIRFLDAAGHQVGRLDGVGLDFAETWAQRGIAYHQVAVLHGQRWEPVDLPGTPLTDWPMLVTVGDTAVVAVQGPDQEVRVWRSADGRAWTGGDPIVAAEGSPIRSQGVSYRDGDAGPVLFTTRADGSAGWQSTDGVHWTPDTVDPGQPTPLKVARGWIRTPDQTGDGSWQMSSDGTAWQPVPGLRDVVDKWSPSGAGGSSESAVGNTLFFNVDESGSPFRRDLWMIQFELPPG